MTDQEYIDRWKKASGGVMGGMSGSGESISDVMDAYKTDKANEVKEHVLEPLQQPLLAANDPEAARINALLSAHEGRLSPIATALDAQQQSAGARAAGQATTGNPLALRAALQNQQEAGLGARAQAGGARAQDTVQTKAAVMRSNLELRQQNLQKQIAMASILAKKYGIDVSAQMAAAENEHRRNSSLLGAIGTGVGAYFGGPAGAAAGGALGGYVGSQF